MKNINTLQFVLMLFLMSSTCEKEGHDFIFFRNQSDQDLVVTGDWWYPDTTIIFSNPALGNDEKIAAYTNKKVMELKDNFEVRFQHHERIMIFVFDAQTLETTPWDTVKKNYLVLKRYDLSYEDLDSMNWTITYP